MIEAGRSRWLAIVLLAPSRQRDQDHLCSIWQSPQALCSLGTVHPRHPEIEEDNVRAKSGCLRYAFLPIGRGHDADHAFCAIYLLIVHPKRWKDVSNNMVR